MSGQGRGRGRPYRGRWDVLAQQDIPFQEKKVGQNDAAIPSAQDAMGTLAREMAGAL